MIPGESCSCRSRDVFSLPSAFLFGVWNSSRSSLVSPGVITIIIVFKNIRCFHHDKQHKPGICSRVRTTEHAAWHEVCADRVAWDGRVTQELPQPSNWFFSWDSFFPFFFFLFPPNVAAAFQQGKIPPTPFSAPPPAGAMIPPPPSIRKSELDSFYLGWQPSLVVLHVSWTCK